MRYEGARIPLEQEFLCVCVHFTLNSITFCFSALGYGADRGRWTATCVEKTDLPTTTDGRGPQPAGGTPRRRRPAQTLGSPRATGDRRTTSDTVGWVSSTSSAHNGRAAAFSATE